MPVYQRISDLCKLEGSQRKLADKIKISSASVSSIIKNKAGVRSETIIAILKVYPKLRPEWLLLDEGEMWHGDDYIPTKESDEAMSERLIKLLEFRVAELEREILQDNPELAAKLGIDED